ncbi:MAG: carboxymuconolactone decarboxylase family protein [Arenicella sp.]
MSDDRFENGLVNRKEVMGEEFVERAFSSVTDFTEPLQQMVTENAWGTVWDRDGISKKTRSLVTISMLVALKASTELQGHVRGALRNGCTVEEIQEVFLHASVYCGFPAAIEAFRSAKPIIEEWQQNS